MIGIKNAKIYTISDGIIARGHLIIDEGKIRAIGKHLDLTPCHLQIDAKGRSLTPGLIDAHSHVGIAESGVGAVGSDHNELGQPLSANCRAIDAVNMQDHAFETLRRAGVTTVGIMPGSANIVGGSALAVKCKGLIVDQSVLKNPIGIKVALGENPKHYYKSKEKSPGTRMGNAAVLRQALQAAKDLMQANSSDDDPLNVRALIAVLKKQLPLMIHCHRHDDIVSAIRICREFDVNYVLEHVTDGHLVKDLLKGEGVHCAVGPTLHYGSKRENKDRDFKTALAFHHAAIPFCLISDHPVVDGRNLILTASIATQWGLPDHAALKAVTLAAAEHIGVSARVGSIEVGKDADLILWSDHPLELTSFVDITIIDGQVVYQREATLC